jgi:hypothetical protein
MILVTKRRFLGSISGHSIYTISKSQLVMVSHPSHLTNVAVSAAEKRFI